MRMLKRSAVAAALVLLPLLVLAVDPERLADALADVPPGHALAALVVVQFQIVLSALRWRFTARRLGHPMSRRRAIREYYLGGILNQTLPGGIAGDATRAYRTGCSEAGGWKRATAAVVMERLSGQFAFFMLTFIGLLAWAPRLPAEVGLDLRAVALAALSIVATIIAAVLLSRPLRTWGARHLPDIAAVFWKDGAFVVQAGLSILIVAGYVATFLIASAAVGAPLPPAAAFTIIPLCLLTMLVPIGIGGWGSREAAAALLWPLVGYTSAQGLAASLLYGAFSLAGTALPGLVVYAASAVGGWRQGTTAVR